LQVAFRRCERTNGNAGAVSAWMRRGEIVARDVSCEPYDESIFKRQLTEIRKLTIEPVKVFLPRLKALCAEAGVAAVFVKELPGAGISGLTRWLTPGKALIQLSLLYKTDDHLWFTFFHEACHILRHRKSDIYFEQIKGNNSSVGAEEEANIFSRDFLIPASDYRQLISSASYKSKAGLNRFATKIGISPGIVVGRLQYDRYLPYSYMHDLKRKFVWNE
jgi:HTH-type transcriptional regulator / antitoxin HigA